MANKILNLDFSKDPIMPPIIYGRVGDEKMQTITVKISRRDEIPDLSGGIITFEGEPAGGKVKVFDSENVSSNNAGLQKGTFEYTFPSAAFSVEGTYKRAYFSFQKDGKRDTTGDFKIIVKGNADIDAGEAETIITEYNKLVKALNEAYQAALNKMNTDYDDVEKRIEAIKVDLNTLKEQITDILVDAEGRISAIGKSVTDEVDAALEKFKEGNFYTKQEADNRFLSKTENLDIQNKKLTNDDGSGLPLPKGVTSFKELSGYAGFYYLNATVAGAMTDKADLPPEFKYSALYVYQHAIAGTAGAMYQEIRINSLTKPLIAFRMTSPNSSQNSPFKILATTDSVVNITEPQRIGGTKEFSKTPLVNGKEVALKDETFIYKKAGLDEVEAAYRSAFGAETNILLVRKGNKVDAYLRVNVTDADKLKPNMVQIFKIPKGFMVDQQMRAGYWNTALTTVQYTHPQGNYGALYEEGVKGIRFCSDRKGNHYVCGSWYTADAFPET
ncbi:MULTISPECIES: BppU family phage baseplate upper protein [Bacillota]|uniref:BppU family phage baseplate upper protein n=1 Tax=Bacillota TaxID=1239 RepID=UPI000666C92D|nr:MULTISPECIES: BppU family phage baseplate upper protein [Bacillota]EIW2161192.1 BppU family phage baseplate upper protein [Enterococcus faecalis]MDI7021360.1 BppU family phage baseplate upper protein [Enterococcus faecalis]MDK8203667.1 BppU family phage baseplate upper protein [Enterococcus faecalis]MDK8222224.1 BppU family phage baseplate upper protein [Enterococcus faecalis]MDK8246475.1 BppU family phage baseplate upper protein [Enterococcus faecalis]